jgi:hypothetical protein
MIDITTLVPPQYAGYAAAAVGVAAAVSSALPPPSSPTGTYAWIYGIFNFVGANFGYAKNAVASAPPPPAVTAPPAK